MNLYGWSLAEFKQILGSKDASILDRVDQLLSESKMKEPDRSKSMAWARTLVERGIPLRQLGPSAEPADGELLTVQMEAEIHVIALYYLARAISREEYLDLASESSRWAHPAIRQMYGELHRCEFRPPATCGVDYFRWMETLTNGLPLFGEAFRTSWSFYSLLSLQDLTGMIAALEAAIAFERRLPKEMPDALRSKMAVALSTVGKEFVRSLIGLFGKIERAGQDAFILWW